jgi:hypothetical protein
MACLWGGGPAISCVDPAPLLLSSLVLFLQPPFQGDAHVAQAVGLAAFGSQAPLYSLVRAMLNLTDSAAHPVHDSNIATYPLWWTLSVIDYWRASGDVATLEAYASGINATILAAAAFFLDWSMPVDLRWVGWVGWLKTHNAHPYRCGQCWISTDPLTVVNIRSQVVWLG